MSFAIAAAGTGGHVFPGLAVGEELVAAGVPRDEVLYLGGDRLEAEVFPAAGFPFLQLEIRGLARSLSAANLRIPLLVWRAVASATAAFRDRGVRAVLGMGGYATVPAALAARRVGASLAVSEQNAEAGLANRLAARLAARRFGSFPVTEGLAGAEWVGNPLRHALACFHREALRSPALARHGLDPERPVLGVFGGSLGAGALNRAVALMLSGWEGPDLQVLHLAGSAHATDLSATAAQASVLWRVVPFEERMELFYAACDLVVARAGGAVAELTATATPAVLVPGGFGSGRHQEANAAVLEAAGAAVVLPEEQLDRLGQVVAGLLADPERRERMASAAASLARPDAAARIATALRELHG